MIERLELLVATAHQVPVARLRSCVRFVLAIVRAGPSLEKTVAPGVQAVRPEWSPGRYTRQNTETVPSARDEPALVRSDDELSAFAGISGDRYSHDGVFIGIADLR